MVAGYINGAVILVVTTAEGKYVTDFIKGVFVRLIVLWRVVTSWGTGGYKCLVFENDRVSPLSF